MRAVAVVDDDDDVGDARLEAIVALDDRLRYLGGEVVATVEHLGALLFEFGDAGLGRRFLGLKNTLGLFEVFFALGKRGCLGFDRLADSAEFVLALLHGTAVDFDLSLPGIGFTDAGCLRDLLASPLQPFVALLELGALLHLELLGFFELLALLGEHRLGICFSSASMSRAESSISASLASAKSSSRKDLLRVSQIWRGNSVPLQRVQDGNKTAKRGGPVKSALRAVHGAQAKPLSGFAW
ncbi:MAG: hypothetical protein JRG67_16930 [Deltaproteobacteria bacterium]|nr:hypothetical protein [Deltaproteobacteria bacterium]